MYFNWASLKFTPSVNLDLIWVSFTLPEKVRVHADPGLILDIGGRMQELEQSILFLYSVTAISFVPKTSFPLNLRLN